MKSRIYKLIEEQHTDDEHMHIKMCQTENARPGVMIGDLCFDSSKICR